MVVGQPADGQPERRVVLLGASNLARGISTAVETACRIGRRPVDLLLAAGHGRSYGLRHSFLGYSLPGIVDSGLWEDLARREPLPTTALVTDIGNDLFYGAEPERIASWVDKCLERLQQADARVVITLLPLVNVDRCQGWKYRAFRSVFFPLCRLRLPDIVERARELDERLRERAAARRIVAVEPKAEWYGFDPIHLTIVRWPRAWREILSPWDNRAVFPAPRPSPNRWAYLRLLPPQRRWMWGIERSVPQPAGRLPDGSTVSKY